MDVRADTLSGRFGGQWAFLSTPPNQGSGSRSLPPSSSYLRSDRSNITPLPPALHFQHLNASRSSLPRHAQTPSIGGRSSTATIPTQPVLVRVHSADASLQIHPPRRPTRPRRRLKDMDDLPPVEEYSIRGILAAIAEDIEEDVNAISEILGRSRLVLADQHDSHLPPQGEIRAVPAPLQAVAEASSSNEMLAAVATDEVLILREDASLVDGSHTGSQAYGLLERFQAVPRTRRMRSDITGSVTSRPGTGSIRHYSAPPVMPGVSPSVDEDHEALGFAPLPQSSRWLLQSSTDEDGIEEPPSRATNAVVSETYLSAGANAVVISDPPVVSESGRNYPLYSFDYREVFEGPMPSATPPAPRTFRERLQSFMPRVELQSFMPWMHGESRTAVSAESQLREILHRHQLAGGRRVNQGPNEESPDMYT